MLYCCRFRVSGTTKRRGFGHFGWDALAQKKRTTTQYLAVDIQVYRVKTHSQATGGCGPQCERSLKHESLPGIDGATPPRILLAALFGCARWVEDANRQKPR